MGTVQAWQAVRGYRADIALDIDAQGQVMQAALFDELPCPLVAPVPVATTLTLPVTFSLIGGPSLGDISGSVAGKAD